MTVLTSTAWMDGWMDGWNGMIRFRPKAAARRTCFMLRCGPSKEAFAARAKFKPDQLHEVRE